MTTGAQTVITTPKLYCTVKIHILSVIEILCSGLTYNYIKISKNTK
jgi:hypothetical protein